MAFKEHDFSVLAYSNGFTVWHYKTEDSLSDVDGDSYFNEATDMLRTGDMIMISAAVDGEPAACIRFALSSKDGVVQLAKLS